MNIWRLFFSFLIILVSTSLLRSQTVILDDPGPYSYTASDAVTVDNFIASGTTCTSVSFSFDYSFSLDWTGSNNMESLDDCLVCNGNPDSQNSGCDDCWDFLDAQFTIGSTVVYYDIIGDAGTTDAEQNGTLSFGPVCSDGDDLDLRIRTQTWAGDETATFTNIMILCWEAVPEITFEDPACEGQPLDVEGSAGDPAAVADWQWGTSGTGVFTNATMQNTTVNGASDGDEFFLSITDVNGCGATTSANVTFAPAPPATSTTVTDCASNLQSFNLNTIVSEVSTTDPVTWYNGQPSLGGTLISPVASADISSASGVDLWALVTGANGCTAEVQITVNEIAGPTGQISGIQDLCPGDCVDIIIDFNGGTSPYLIDLSLGTFPPATIPNFATSDIIMICYDAGGPIFDPGTFTFDVPPLPFAFSIDLTLNALIDDNGCMGTVLGGPVNITFNQAPDANAAGPLTECDDGSGSATFDLSQLDNLISGGSGTVVYYSDMDGIDPIGTSYTGPSTTVYAQVLGTPCDSEIIPIELIVGGSGDAGTVTTYCDAPGTASCLICDQGTPGEVVTLFIDFANPAVTGFDIAITNGSGTTVQTISTLAADDMYTFTITENTTFEVTLAYVTGGCNDATDLGILITINLATQPSFIDPGPQQGCGQVILPALTSVSGPPPSYFTSAAGTGMPLAVGTVLTTSQTIFAYAGVPDCALEFPVQITVLPNAILQPVAEVSACGSYMLPAIQGANLSTVGYFSGPAGSGTPYAVGDLIGTSITPMYIFAQCGDVEVSFNINIAAGPTFTTGDTIVCEQYIVSNITGTSLSGNEAYFAMPGGMGSMVNVGDTITQDSTLYIYDPVPGCTQDIPIDITIVNDKEAGNDSLVVLCLGDDQDIDPFTILGADADTTGFWVDFFANDTLGPIFNFNFRDSLVGSYDFIYAIEDSICGDDAALVSFQIVDDAGTMGNNIDISICNDDQASFNLAIAMYPPGSMWERIENGDTIDLLINTYLVANQSEGIDSFLNIFDGGDCGAAISLLTVTIQEPAYAGDPVAGIYCGSTSIDLIGLLANNDGVGTFSESTPSGGLSGSTFNTAGLGVGIYNINHVLPSGNACPPDTAVLSINVTLGPTAGSDVDAETCNREINLFEFLAADADAGGQFFLDGILVPNGDYVIAPGQSEIFTYQVGDGVDCPIDMADIMIAFADIPTQTYVVSLNYCLDTCRSVSVNVSDVAIDTVYATISDGNNSYPLVIPITGGTMGMIELCNIPDGIFDGTNLEPNMIYNITTDSMYSMAEGCTYDGGLMSSDIRTNIYESNFTETYCSDTTVMINGTAYNDDFAGAIVIEGGGQFGCDSVVNLDLTFMDVNFGDTTYYACAGIPFTDPDFGLVWTEANDQDDVTVQTASGCDSIVSVTVVFSDGVISQLPLSFCEGGSEMVLGVLFDADNLTDTINTGIQSAAGCDSLVVVTATLSTPPSSELTGLVCDDYVEEVAAGVFFEASNMGTSIVVGTAANGCDSLLFNNYQYDLQPTVGNIDTIVCDSTFSIQIGQRVFDINDPVGSLDFPDAAANGCDSIINVNIVFESFEYAVSFINPTCDNPLGGLVIESVSPDGFYTIEWEGQVDLFMASDLPLTIEGFPLGLQSFEIRQSSGMGCSQFFDHDFLIPSTIDFTATVDTDGQINITNSDSITSIVWTPADGLSCTDCVDPIATPTETTTYIGTITYGDGCPAEVQVTVEVQEPAPRFTDYYVPNIFNPTGSSGNRTFFVTPSTFAEGTVTSMGIYDRWGNLVFFSDDAIGLSNREGWDGTFGGTEPRQGVYVYAITIEEPATEEGQAGRSIRLVGDVTLMR